MSYGCCCDGHNIQSVMEHIDNRTAHLNRSFLLKTEDDVITVITVSVKKRLTLIPGCVYLKYYSNSVKEKLFQSLM